MKRGVIITCPDYDDVTKIFFEYSKEIKRFVKQKEKEIIAFILFFYPKFVIKL